MNKTVNIPMNNINRNPPVMLVILDGFGHSSKSPGNAVAHAKMPFWKWLTQNYPHTLLHAAGEHVGLPEGYIGNSEVGHLTIGSGRIVESVLKKFHDEIISNKFFENKILISNFSKLKQPNTNQPDSVSSHTDKALHLIGLLSDGGVHSHESHLYACLKLAKNLGLKNVFIHVILDGRDVAPKSAAIYLNRLEAECKQLGCGQIASISGRFYAMDRDNNWDRTRQFYDMLVGENPSNNTTPQPWQTVLSKEYSNIRTDEFVTPTLINPDGFIKPGDGVVFFNFRPDRAKQITESFINPDFDKFKVSNLCSTNHTLAFFITPTRYSEGFAKYSNEILFERKQIQNTLLDIFAQQPVPPKVFIIAETEKYAHVTYFFHGMQDHQNPNEVRVLIPSIKTKNYINYPEMCANEITATVLKSLKLDPADFYLINYANADMVGHSGDFDATVKACECLDKQIEQLYKIFVEKMNGTMVITADHGNAEEKIDHATGTQLTAHTQNPVPFILVTKDIQSKQNAVWPIKPKFGISSIAPTILNFIGLKKPEEMSAEKTEL
jgi:2,3-bisphosphoglycerate-independent phosphoglycerate mutase